MKGWLFKEIHEPLELVERPDPTPGAGEIAIDVKAVGFCHSDVGVMEGICTSSLAYYPMILGHEFAVISNPTELKDFELDTIIDFAGFESTIHASLDAFIMCTLPAYFRHALFTTISNSAVTITAAAIIAMM